MLRLFPIIGCLLLTSASCFMHAQSPGLNPQASLPRVDTLELSPAQTIELKQALEAKDYISAEKVLLPELQKDSHSPHASRLLNFVGAIYFLNQDYLNAAIAWKKSEKIAPLDTSIQFSLAMAYVRLHHADWAMAVLQSLAAQNPADALYPYWLGKLHYDAHRYDQALAEYGRAVALAPSMARAYDGLGLCYFYENQNDLAIRSYKTAIALDEQAAKHSPWPYLDLALTLEFLHQVPEAKANLLRAIQIDPGLAQAHFHLGSLLHAEDKTAEAIREYKTAAELDPRYAEPHFALARIYNGLGQKAAANAEVQIYRRLHDNPAEESRRESTREE